MEECESFEVAVEQRRVGALAASDVRGLEEHLATCSSCRQFADFVTRSERAMATADAAMTETDWAAIKKGLRHGPTHILHQRLLHIAFALAASPLIMLAIGYRPSEGLPWLLVWMIPPFAVRIALDRRISREMAMLGARDADFFDAYRSFVRRRIRYVWATIIWLPLAALGLDLYGWALAGAGTDMTAVCRVLLVIVASLVSVWIYVAWLRRYQQIRAQLP